MQCGAPVYTPAHLAQKMLGGRAALEGERVFGVVTGHGSCERCELWQRQADAVGGRDAQRIEAGLEQRTDDVLCHAIRTRCLPRHRGQYDDHGVAVTGGKPAAHAGGQRFRAARVQKGRARSGARRHDTRRHGFPRPLQERRPNDR
jgi:hypothetical protein